MMPDFTMCMTRTCPKKERCYRFSAKPDTLQSYSDFTESCNKKKENYFMSNKRRIAK